MRVVIAALLLLVTLHSATALDACNFEVDPGNVCTETTTVLGACTVYNVSIYSPTYTLFNNTFLSQIGSTGAYAFNFSSGTTGVHKWVACDNSTGTISVRQTLHNKSSEVLLDTAELQANQSNWAFYPRDVWLYSNRTVTWNGNSSAQSIWSYIDRQLTWTNSSSGGATITAADITLITRSIWNETVTCMSGWKNASNATSAICTIWNINRFV